MEAFTGARAMAGIVVKPAAIGVSLPQLKAQFSAVKARLRAERSRRSPMADIG